MAAFPGTEREASTVAAEERADLLLDGNPLENVRHVAGLAGVILGGRWLPCTELEARLDNIGTYRGGASGTVDLRAVCQRK